MKQRLRTAIGATIRVLQARLWAGGLCCVCGALAQPVVAQVTGASLPERKPWVVAVAGGAGAAYEQAIEALEQSLAQAWPQQQEQPPVVLRLNGQGMTQPFRPPQPAPKLYVALGVQACARFARLPQTVLGGAPVLCALLPQQSFDYLLGESGRRAGPDFSALYLDQPLGRQLDLLRLALPRARRVGLLLGAGPDAQQTEEKLAELARERGLRLFSTRIGVGEPIFPGLKQVLDESDVLLALADPQIYNSHTIQNILLASFRAKVPMQAFSPAYVRAGALLALYATPEQIGEQVARLVRDALQEQNGRVRGFGPPRYTEDFEVSVNAHVARSLGLQLNAEDLTRRLRRLESRNGPEQKSSVWGQPLNTRSRLAKDDSPGRRW
jgi:putative ABC transport system substrate-binding protein